MSNFLQHLAVDIPNSRLITSRSQAALGALLPDPDLHGRLTEGLRQLDHLSLELFFSARRRTTTSRQRGLAGIEELSLPATYRLLADFLATSSISDRQLASDHAEHDPGLLLHRNLRVSSHLQILLQDLHNDPAKILTRDSDTVADPRGCGLAS